MFGPDIFWGDKSIKTLFVSRVIVNLLHSFAHVSNRTHTNSTAKPTILDAFIASFLFSDDERLNQ